MVTKLLCRQYKNASFTMIVLELSLSFFLFKVITSSGMKSIRSGADYLIHTAMARYVRGKHKFYYTDAMEACL